MTSDELIAESDLHAYADGELESQTLAEVERWLSEHPEDAAKVHAIKLQNHMMHELYDDGLDAPWPAGVEELLTDSRNKNWWPGWTRMAASFLLLIIGGAVGWGSTLFGTVEQTAGQGFVQRALYAHVVYSDDDQRPD